MNRYLRGMFAFALIAIIIGGFVSLVAAVGASTDYNPAGALVWVGIGSSLFSSGILSLFLFLHASAIVAGKDAPAHVVTEDAPAE
ncbi:MAG TPA: hypothetical protein VHZ81_01100 [Galbitalea sp.]|jgi:hypothetical protein|nr:hypothetical protein [Galbitalea sp.]